MTNILMNSQKELYLKYVHTILVRVLKTNSNIRWTFKEFVQEAQYIDMFISENDVRLVIWDLFDTGQADLTEDRKIVSLL